MPVKVHVNQHIIRKNIKCDEREPPITVIRGSNKRTRHMSVELVGKVRVVYSPDKPLKCGARLWIEADDAIGDDDAPAQI